MQLPILIERVAGNGYRATSSPSFTITVEGTDREEVLQRLLQAITERLGTDAEIISLEIPAQEHPLAPYAGMFKDNPLFDEWQQAVAEYRRQADKEEEQEAP
jgi:hypothetical protein